MIKSIIQTITNDWSQLINFNLIKNFQISIEISCTPLSSKKDFYRSQDGSQIYIKKYINIDVLYNKELFPMYTRIQRNRQCRRLQRSGCPILFCEEEKMDHISLLSE